MAIRLFLASLLLILMTACSSDEPPPDAAAPPPAAPAPAAPAPAAPAPADPAAGTTASDTTTPSASETADAAAPDIADKPALPKVCSTLIENYERCIENHLPESGRDLLRAALEQSRTHWNQAAADATTEETQRQLAAACEQSKIELQTQMSGYGCIL